MGREELLVLARAAIETARQATGWLVRQREITPLLVDSVRHVNAPER